VNAPHAELDDPVLLARIERLERRARRDRVLALGALVVALATAQAPPPPASLAPSSLGVRGADGTSALLDGAGLTVRSAAGVAQLYAGLDTTGSPYVSEADANGHQRESLFLYDNGAPGLRQFDAAHVVRTDVYLASGADPTIHLSNAQGVAQASLFIGDKGLPEFDVRNTHGDAVGYLSADDQGAFLNMRDPSLNVRTYAGQYTDGTWGVDVRNATNTNLFKAP